jgi:hypothetical protein
MIFWTQPQQRCKHIAIYAVIYINLFFFSFSFVLEIYPTFSFQKKKQQQNLQAYTPSMISFKKLIVGNVEKSKAKLSLYISG